jgi:DNA-binding response OmpR family regulator
MVMDCRGRAYPKACYVLVITLLDASSNEERSNSLLVIALIVGLVLIVIAMLVLRRKSIDGKDAHVIKLGRFLFDRRNMELTLKEERIELTSKESDLLYLLFGSVNETVERDDILKSVWGDDGDYVGRTLDVFISKLRKKLEADSNIKIINIRGIGYKLVVNEN